MAGPLRVAVAALAPLLVLALVFVALIRPRTSQVDAAAARIATLERRVDDMRASIAGAGVDDGGLAEISEEIERRIPVVDPVPMVLEQLMQPGFAGADEVQNLIVETGARRAAQVDGTDPRLGILPTALVYTPIRVSFDGPYSRVGRLLWELGALPTLVEVGSLDVQSAADGSLVHVELVLRAFERNGVSREGAIEKPPEAAEVAEAVDVTSLPEWSRNPLAPVAPPIEPAVEVVPDPVVESILYSRQRRVALVDGRIVTVGDAVSAGRVVAIEPDVVIVESESGERRRFELQRRLATEGRD
jgi:Tfp pilus assembly protein PilO